MIRHAIDTSRNSTPAINQEFVRKLKFKLGQVPVTGSHTRKFEISHSAYAILMPNVKEVRTVKTAKMNKELTKNGRFWLFALDD